MKRGPLRVIGPEIFEQFGENPVSRAYSQLEASDSLEAQREGLLPLLESLSEYVCQPPHRSAKLYLSLLKILDSADRGDSILRLLRAVVETPRADLVVWAVGEAVWKWADEVTSEDLLCVAESCPGSKGSGTLLLALGARAYEPAIPLILSLAIPPRETYPYVKMPAISALERYARDDVRDALQRIVRESEEAGDKYALKLAKSTLRKVERRIEKRDRKKS